ncbi:hypothetical protein DS885_08115 [Psychromonas sp. B3M02]|nr:hypothetical protein DS885_08115 [Psychromonas sp. B3M02]
MDFITLILVVPILVIGLNLIFCILFKRIFVFGHHHKLNRNMSISELKMKVNKPFIFGNWYRKGEAKYASAVFANSLLFAALLFATAILT